MTEQHTITPPSELVQQWLGEFFSCVVSGELSDSEKFLATQAANWGANQELEACCAWLKAKEWIHPEFSDELRAARRPKSPSLKEQALHALLHIDQGQHNERCHIIRRALEQLDD